MATKILGFTVIGDEGLTGDISTAWGKCWNTIGNWGGQLDSPFDVNPKGRSRKNLVELQAVPSDANSSHSLAVETALIALREQITLHSYISPLQAVETVIRAGHNQAATIDAALLLVAEKNNDKTIDLKRIREMLEQKLQSIIDSGVAPTIDLFKSVQPTAAQPTADELQAEEPGAPGEILTAVDRQVLANLNVTPERSLAFKAAIGLSFILQVLPAIFMNTVGSVFLNSIWTIRIHTARMARGYLFSDWNLTELELLRRNRQAEAEQKREALERQIAEPVTPDNRDYVRIGVLGLPGLIVTWTAVAITLTLTSFLRETWRSFRNQFARAALTIFDYQFIMVLGADNKELPKPVSKFKDLDYNNPGFIERSAVDKGVIRTWPRWGAGVLGLIPAAIAIVFTAVIAGTVFETYRSARLTASYFKSWWLEGNDKVPKYIPADPRLEHAAQHEEYKNYERDKARTWNRHIWGGIFGYTLFSALVIAGIGIATIYQESKKSWIEAKNIFKGMFWDYNLTEVQPPLSHTLTPLANIARHAVREDRHPGRRYAAGGLGWIVSALSALPVLLVLGVLKQSLRSIISVYCWLAETVFEDKKLFSNDKGQKGEYSDNRLNFPQKVPLGLLGYIVSIGMLPFAFVISLGREGLISAVNVFTKFDSLMGTRRRSANELAELVQLRDRINGELRDVNDEIKPLANINEDDRTVGDSEKLNDLYGYRNYLTARLANINPKIAALEATIPTAVRRPAATVPAAVPTRTVQELFELREAKDHQVQQLAEAYRNLSRAEANSRTSASAAVVGAGTTSGAPLTSLAVEEDAPSSKSAQLSELERQLGIATTEYDQLNAEYGKAARAAKVQAARNFLSQPVPVVVEALNARDDITLTTQQRYDSLYPEWEAAGQELNARRTTAAPVAAGVEPVESTADLEVRHAALEKHLRALNKIREIETERQDAQEFLDRVEEQALPPIIPMGDDGRPVAAPTESVLPVVPVGGGPGQAANDPAMVVAPGWSNRAPDAEGWIREAMGCIGFALSSIVSVVGLSLYWLGRENVRLYGAHWRYFDGLLVNEHHYVPLTEHTNQTYSKWYHYAGGAPLAAVWWVTSVLALPVALLTYYTTWPLLQMNAFAFKQNFKNLWNKAMVDHSKWTDSPEYRPSPWNGTTLKTVVGSDGQSINVDETEHNSFVVRRYYVMGFIGAALGLAMGAVAFVGALIVRESYRSAKYGIGAVFDWMYERGVSLDSITAKGQDEEEQLIPRGEASRSNWRVAIGFLPGAIATLASILFIGVGGAVVSFWHGAKGKIADHEGKYKIGQGPVSKWGGVVLGSGIPVIGNIIGYIGLRNLLTPSFWKTVFSYGPKNPLHVGVTVIPGILLFWLTAVVLGATKLVQAIFGLGLFPRKPGVETLKEKHTIEKAKQQAARNPQPDSFVFSKERVAPLATEPAITLADDGQFAHICEDIALIESVFKDANAATNWLGQLPRITVSQQGPVHMANVELQEEANEQASPAVAKPADSFTPAGIMSQIATAIRQIFTFALPFNDEPSIRRDLEAFRKLYMAEGIRADFNPYRFFRDRQDATKQTVILDGKEVLKNSPDGKDPQSLMNEAVVARAVRQHGGVGFFERRYPVAGNAAERAPERHVLQQSVELGVL